MYRRLTTEKPTPRTTLLLSGKNQMTTVWRDGSLFLATPVTVNSIRLSNALNRLVESRLVVGFADLALPTGSPFSTNQSFKRKRRSASKPACWAMVSWSVSPNWIIRKRRRWTGQRQRREIWPWRQSSESLVIHQKTRLCKRKTFCCWNQMVLERQSMQRRVFVSKLSTFCLDGAKDAGWIAGYALNSLVATLPLLPIDSSINWRENPCTLSHI